MEFLNPWKSDKQLRRYYDIKEVDLVYKNGDYAVYHVTALCHTYTYKNIAIGQKVGLNKDFVDSLANNIRPTDETQYSFDRAHEVMKAWKKYIQ